MNITTARGLTDSGRESVETVFFQHLARGWHPGAQLAVYREGNLILNLVGGEAESGRPLHIGTPMLLFSSIKPVVAACIHLLVENDLLDYDAPVARYWPQFANGGKEQVTVRHVLTHQGGFPHLTHDFDWSRLGEWKYVTNHVSELTTDWAPGTGTGYHTLTYGWVLGELIRLVDGRMPRDFMRDEIFDPLGITSELSLGLEQESLQERSLVHAMTDVTRRDPAGVNGTTSRIAVAFNNPTIARSQVPAANGYGTARGLARFYDALGLGRPILLMPKTLEHAVTLQGETKRDRSVGTPKRYGLGFYLSGLSGDPFNFHAGDGVFGHSGQQSSVGYADYRYDLAVAYVTNGLQEPTIVMRRNAEMASIIRRACA